MDFNRLKPEHRPPVRAMENGVPVYNFGYASVYGAAPELVNDHIWQSGNVSKPQKQPIKKSWEIKDNYIGVCTTRMPRLPEHDEQTLEVCHLIDGDDTSCWASYPHSIPNDRPVWIRIDLARACDISRIVLRKRRITFDRSQYRGSFLTGGYLGTPDDRVQEIGRAMPGHIIIRTSNDGWQWKEHFNGNIDRSEKEFFTFDVNAFVKQIYIEGNELDLCENWCYMFSIASVEAYDSEGRNVALLSQGCSAIASSAHHMGQTELEATDWYWTMHYDLGVKWSRIGYHDDMINWHWVEREKGVLEVDKKADDAVTELYENGVKIIFNINFGNRLYEGYAERRFPQLNEWYYETPFPPRSPEALEAWDRFVRYCVEHFKDRVEVFEVWNEWNGEGYWGDVPDTEHYIYLAKRTISIIRELAPEKTIMMGSYAGFPHNQRPENCDDIIAPFYRAIDELAPLVDAIGYHPFYQPDVTSDIYNHYPENLKALQDYCVSRGFKGNKYMASEYSVTAWTPAFRPGTPCVWWTGNGALNYSDIQKAKIIAQFIVMNSALGVYTQYCELSQNNYVLDNSLLFTGWETYPIQASAPAAAYYVMRNLCTAMDEYNPSSIDYEISDTDNVWNFSMEKDGKKAVCLWLRGEVSDNCAGKEIDIKLPFKANKITAYNCMNGEYSDIVFSSDGENTVVNDLIIRDYPLILEIEE